MRFSETTAFILQITTQRPLIHKLASLSTDPNLSNVQSRQQKYSPITFQTYPLYIYQHYHYYLYVGLPPSIICIYILLSVDLIYCLFATPCNLMI